MPIQIVRRPNSTKKAKAVGGKDVQQWSGELPEAVAAPRRPEYGATTTMRDESEYVRRGKVAELWDEGQSTQGGK